MGHSKKALNFDEIPPQNTILSIKGLKSEKNKENSFQKIHFISKMNRYCMPS